MKLALRLSGLPLLLTICISNVSHGLDQVGVQPAVQGTSHCYALAMVGMDSVINSRLGILPEHLLELALTDPNASITPLEELDSNDLYSARLLRIIFDAYLWDGAPYEYASQVFAGCSL